MKKIKEEDIIINYAKIEDAKIIEELERNWIEEGNDHDMNPYTPKEIEEAILDKRIILAEHESIIMGYLFFEIEDNKCELDAIYIRKDYRNQKVGQMLMEYFLEIERVKACKKVYLLADSVYEEKLVKFYEKFGFNKVAIRMLLNLKGK